MVGIKIKQAIENDNSGQIIVTKNDVTWQSYSYEEYQDLLEDLVDQGILSDATLEANEWTLIDEFEYHRKAKFTLELKPQLNQILKMYTLVKVSVQCICGTTACANLYAIMEFMKKTNFLNRDKTIDLRDNIDSWTDSQKRDIPILKEFLRFSQLDNMEEYYIILNGVTIPDSKTRIIPSYQSIITFDYIIQQFMENGQYDLKMRYYPILIWWQLTKIIPLRPIELYILERSWVYEQNGKYFIHIQRRKRKKYSQPKVPPLTEIEVSKELFELLVYYIWEGKSFNNSKYILNYEFMTSFRKNQNTTKRNTDFCGGSVFRKLLLEFYREIVEKGYSYTLVPKEEERLFLQNNEVEFVNIGDTRHIAICSMMLQGMNELTIAQLAGHTTLTEQITYCGHLENYTKAYTYILAKSFQNKFRLGKPLETNSLSKESVFRKEIFKNADKILRHGEENCLSENFPFECDVDECIFCNLYIPNKDISMIVLDKSLEELDKEIELRLNYIKYIITDAIKSKSNKDLKSNTKMLNTVLKRKAIIEAYKMNLGGENC